MRGAPVGTLMATKQHRRHALVSRLTRLLFCVARDLHNAAAESGPVATLGQRPGPLLLTPPRRTMSESINLDLCPVYAPFFGAMVRDLEG